jgi:ATP-dependent DNA ligase
MISRKLDGVRTICILNNGIPEFFSRTGTQFQTLSNLNEQATKVLNLAKQMYGEEFVLDGECCLYDENGNDDFNGIMKEITRKNHTIANPKYVIFDLIKKSEFDNSLGTTKFGERIEMLEKLNVEQFGNNILTIPHANTISKQTYDE